MSQTQDDGTETVDAAVVDTSAGLLPSVTSAFDVKVQFVGFQLKEIPRVCYALAHNRIPFVQSIEIRVADSSVPKKITIKVFGEWAANERSPIKEAEFALDAPSGSDAIQIDGNGVQLSDIALADLEEGAPATLVFRLTDDLGRTQDVRYDIEVYSRDQWLNNPEVAVVTAAFVQPNHPDVSRVLARAADILRSNGTPGISGYQSVSTGQHHLIAAAIFLALQDFIKTYVNPPASFEELGQKLRPIDRVLEEKQGTCIDLACAYASCLEQAGLHPVIFLVKGHAFSGYITDGSHLNSSIIQQWSAIKSLLDSQVIIGVETVCIPAGESFAEAQAAVRQHFNEQRMESVLDVSRAHMEGVRPIPARILRDNVITVVIDNGPASAPIIERRDPTTRKLLADSIPARVQSWKNSLLDLSFNNRLLNLRPDRHGIALIPPLGALGWVEDQLNDGASITIVAQDGLNAIQKQIAGDGLARSLPAEILVEAAKVGQVIFSGIDTKRFKSVISRLRNESRLQEEESGANNLYLTLGSVSWGPKYGDYQSPVFLVPLRINKFRGLNGAVIEMDATQTSSVNYCLIESLRLREQLTLQWFSDDMSDDLGLNIEAGLEALRKEFREKGLDQNGFSVDQTASIALLDFKKFRLWKDLNDHWKDFMKSPVVKHLVETPREIYKDPAAEQVAALQLTDTSMICAQPADGSQIRAIERALAGSSFVLQGPPGSGKSQTITNLLANAMYRGKKVLFVAEKQSALQEVQERLEDVQLGPFCLVLHDSGTKPEKLRQQLREALDQQPKLEEKTHRTFEQRFEAAVHQLDEYRKNVYTANKAGFSFARAYYRLGELGDGATVEIPRPILNLDLELVGELQKNLLELDDITRPAQVRPEHPWLLVGDVAFDALDRVAFGAELTAALSNCGALVAAATGELTDVLTHLVSFDGLAVLASILELKEIGHLPSTAEWQAISSATWRSGVESLFNEFDKALVTVSQDIQGKESFLRRTDLDLALAPIGEAAKSFALGRKKRVREALGPFGEVIDTDSIEPEQVVAKVGRVAEASRAVRSISASLVDMKGLNSLLAQPAVTQVEVAALRARADVLASIASAIGAASPWAAALRALISSNVMAVPGISTTVRATGQTLQSVFTRLGSNSDTLHRWSAGLGLVKSVHERSRKTWEEVLKSGNFLSLQRWMLLRSSLKPYREADLATMCEAIEDGSLAADEAAVAFERGLLLTTLQVRAEETNLDVFDSVAHNSRVLKFIQLLNERRERAQTVIPYYLHKSRAINAGVTTGKVGEFRKEVNTAAKRRRGKSIRLLIERYPDIIGDLTPCFLMSPDSVAQFLPPGKIDFDVVVFDEASQIVVADAIGALGRAKSCVIVGDSKQMPPTKVGVVDAANGQATELEDEGAIEEEESILDEAVTAGFTQELLTWHYRSQDESLIAFSNEHYYDCRLSTFPAPVQFRPDCGVFYRRVEGQFDHGKTRTNEIEANAIVEELVSRLDDPATAGLSYGIVTLNIQQRNLMTELIDQHSHPRIRALRETEDARRRLFVLNLENVQGRERDVIILGTAFSKRLGGGDMPLSFGPLTHVGGEKRLNVAVTRAKRQFVVVTSFDPEEMGGAKSLGMVHLREYLKAARRREARERLVGTSHYELTPQITQVADRLRERGIKVEVGMGLSNFKIDLALTLPGFGEKWLVAVLFDGEEWSERPLAIDRDALPVIVLEGVMSWRRVARVWMPSLRLELDAVVDELVEHVQAAKNMPEPTPPPPPPLPKVESEDADAAETPQAKQRQKMSPPPVVHRVAPAEETLPNEEKFNEFRFPSVQYDASALLTTYAQGLLENLVDAEGPMRTSTAIKRVAYEFGLQRVREAKLAELEPLLHTRKVTELLDELYVWPEILQPDTWRAFRRTTKEERKLEEISPYEIVNAMEVTVRRSITISPEELVRWAGEFFGAGRITEKVEDYLADCIAWGVVTKRFHLEDDRLTRGE